MHMHHGYWIFNVVTKIQSLQKNNTNFGGAIHKGIFYYHVCYTFDASIAHVHFLSCTFLGLGWNGYRGCTVSNRHQIGPGVVIDCAIEISLNASNGIEL